MKYKIANEIFEMNAQCNPLLTHYVYDGSEVGFEITEQDYVEAFISMIHHLLECDAFCFHSSSILCDGEAILFSADSGVGKSTHAALWRKYMSESHQVLSINDDKPILRYMDGVWRCFGSPWAGKHGIQNNVSGNVKALVFLKRGSENKIRKVSAFEAMSKVLRQCIADLNDARVQMKILDYLDSFLKSIDIYELECTISKEACELVYESVWNDHEN